MPAEPADLVTIRDLRAAGVSAKVERLRVARGLWQRPVPGVVALGPYGTDDLVRAALLHGQPHAGLSHSTGAQVWLGRELTGTVHVWVPQGRTITGTASVRYHQSRLWVPPVWCRGLPVVEPALAAAQVAAADDLSEADRRALVTGLVQQRWTTPAEVAAAATLTARRALAQVARLVEEVLAGAQSGPEATFWRAQAEHRMPMPALNHRLGARSLDGYLPELRAGYEVQSREYHAGTWLADTTRMAEILVQHGICLLPVLVPDIDHRLDGLLAELEGFWRTRAHDLGVPLPAHVPPARWRP